MELGCRRPGGAACRRLMTSSSSFRRWSRCASRTSGRWRSRAIALRMSSTTGCWPSAKVCTTATSQSQRRRWPQRHSNCRDKGEAIMKLVKKPKFEDPTVILSDAEIENDARLFHRLGLEAIMSFGAYVLARHADEDPEERVRVDRVE